MKDDMVVGLLAKRSILSSNLSSSFHLYNLLEQSALTSELKPGKNQVPLPQVISRVYLYEITTPDGNTVRGSFLWSKAETVLDPSQFRRCKSHFEGRR